MTEYTPEELRVITACADFRERLRTLMPELQDLAWQTLLGEVGAIMVPPKVAADGVSPQAVLKAARSGRVRYEKIGGRILVNRIDCLRHLGRRR